MSFLNIGCWFHICCIILLYQKSINTNRLLYYGPGKTNLIFLKICFFVHLIVDIYNQFSTNIHSKINCSVCVCVYIPTYTDYTLLVLPPSNNSQWIFPVSGSFVFQFKLTITHPYWIILLLNKKKKKSFSRFGWMNYGVKERIFLYGK